MKKLTVKLWLLCAVLLCSTAGFGQTMIDVATGEYSSHYVKSDGSVWTLYNNVYDVSYVVTQVAGLSGIVETDGGQYNSVFRKSDGTVYSARGGAINSTAYPVDNTGAAFSCSKVYAMWRMIVAIKNGEVWYWSADNAVPEDMLKQFGSLTSSVPRPRKLIQPPGKTIVKCVHGSGISPYSSAILWGIASDGTLWQWDQTHTTPFEVKGKTGFSKKWTGVVKDAAVNAAINMVVTSTNEVWCWGYSGDEYGGHAGWANADMDNITSNLSSAGVVFPLKQIIANYVCVQVIDANNNRFGIGNNQTGSLGSGYMSPSWRTNWNGAGNAVYAYDYMTRNGNQATWLQLPGKWKSIKTNSSFAFYSYGQDMGGNWYSWGRAKAQGLGNGVTWKNLDQSTYPDWRDIPAPRLVTPLTAVWTVEGSVNPAAARNPIANAGINQYLSLGETTTVLNGSGSHQQQPGNSTTVTMTNKWTRISGPNTPAITSPTAQVTTVTGMTGGTYVFRNTVTNSKGAIDYQEVTVVISGTATNQSPTANAGSDIVITLPTNSTTLKGSGSDPDGSISSYNWAKVSGPSSGTLGNASSATASLTNLVQGTYQYQLTVTDNKGAKGQDIVGVTVNGTSNLLPPVNISSLVQGIDYSYYEGTWDLLPDFNKLTPVKRGVASNFSNSVSNQKVLYGLSLSGYINIPSDGQYTFYTSSDDGSSIYIDNNLIVINDGLHGMTEKSGSIGLKAGQHTIKVAFFQKEGGVGLQVSYEGSGIKKQIIPSSVLYRQNLLPAVIVSNLVNGIDYKYYEGTWDALPNFSSLTPVKTGVNSKLDLANANRYSEFGFSFSGYVEIPVDGQYTFYSASDDGSNLLIDNVLVVSNDGLHGKSEKSGSIGLKAGKHAISSLFFQNLGNQYFEVSYEGNGISKQVIPASTLYRQGLLPASNIPNLVNGLDYKYYQGTWNVLPDFSLLKPVKTGSATDFNLSYTTKTSDFAFVFSGYVNVPNDGQYIFYSTSDDGSKLLIDDVLVVSNDGLHGKSEKSGTIGLKAGKHAITSLFFQKYGSQSFEISCEGGGLKKQVIPASLLFRQNLQTTPYQNGASLLATPAPIAKNNEGLNIPLQITGYPNPTSSDFRISVHGGTNEKINILVLGIDGKIISRKEGQTNSNFQFGSNLIPGAYIIKVMQGNSVITQRFIKN